MPNEMYRHATKREEDLLGTRWCTHCRFRRQVEGGKWISLEGRMRRRWKCAQCLANMKARAARTADT